MSFKSLALAATTALICASSCFAQTFTPEARTAFDAALDTRVEAQTRAGYVAIIYRAGETLISTAGMSNIALNQPMTEHTPVRIASMSKPINAVAVMMLVESGDIGLDDALSDYIPAFEGVEVATSPMLDESGEFVTVDTTTSVTVRHLLTHTSGIGYVFDGQTDLGRSMMQASLYQGDGDLEAKIDSLAAHPLYFQPGEAWYYSYANDVLGRVVEVASGMAYEDFLQTRIFDPLMMDDTTFFPSDALYARAAELYVHGPDGQLYPAYSEDNPEYRPTWASGGGGLISTADDYIRFGRMLLNGGELDGTRLLSAETVAQMTSPQITEAQKGDSLTGFSYGFGVGIVLPAGEGETAMGIPGDYGWGGFFDTDFFVSPATQMVAVMMTQNLPNENTPDGRTAAWFRPAVYATLPQQ